MVKDNKNVQVIADIPVQFGGVSIGQSTAKLSMKIVRGAMSLEFADELFCERRLRGRIQLGGHDDGSGQLKFFDTDPCIDGSFDVHRFGVTADAFTTGATFKKNELDLSVLGDFSKGTGRMLVFEHTDIPDEMPDDDHDDTQQSIPGTFSSDLPWRSVSLDLLFTGSLLKALKAAGIGTVGDLHDYTQPDPKSGFEKRLTDIKGIGQSKVQVIEDKLVEFWRDNPQAEKQVLEGAN